ncbi:hypothetical protein OAO01_08080, partial [Oligoflexia bacterium]|nr:hypothetical protein [Oligoflexia bacterium]
GQIFTLVPGSSTLIFYFASNFFLFRSTLFMRAKRNNACKLKEDQDMPAPRKVHYNDAVLFITTSLEEGLLMPANPIIKLFLESILARAQELADRARYQSKTGTKVKLLVTLGVGQETTQRAQLAQLFLKKLLAFIGKK